MKKEDKGERLKLTKRRGDGELHYESIENTVLGSLSKRESTEMERKNHQNEKGRQSKRERITKRIGD